MHQNNPQPKVITLYTSRIPKELRDTAKENAKNQGLPSLQAAVRAFIKQLADGKFKFQFEEGK